MGVDGYTFFNRDPVQVKRSKGVDRPVVDAFQTAVEREGKDRGCIVAFSFTKGAHEEAARVKAKRGMQIQLLTVREILRARGDLRTPVLEDMFPKPPTSFLDLPLPPSRKPSQRPSATRLMRSARDPLAFMA
jgi:hypothetical protein